MKIFLRIFVVCFFFTSCKRKEVKFELLNDNVICERASLDSLKNKKKYNTARYVNEEKKAIFTNVLRFRIENNTNKKLLFFVKDIKLIDLYCVDVEIFDDKEKPVSLCRPLTDPFFDNDTDRIKAVSYIEYYYFKENENKKLLEKMNFKISKDFNKYYEQYVIIEPNESFVFSSTLSLPFIVEDKVLDLGRPIYFELDSSKKYRFALNYKVKEDVEKLFSKELMDNLKENNIEIFKSSLKTQLIPVVFK